MSDIRLFQISSNKVNKIVYESVKAEKSIRTLIVKYLSEEIKEIDKLVKKVVGDKKNDTSLRYYLKLLK